MCMHARIHTERERRLSKKDGLIDLKDTENSSSGTIFNSPCNDPPVVAWTIKRVSFADTRYLTEFCLSLWQHSYNKISVTF